MQIAVTRDSLRDRTRYRILLLSDWEKRVNGHSMSRCLLEAPSATRKWHRRSEKWLLLQKRKGKRQKRDRRGAIPPSFSFPEFSRHGRAIKANGSVLSVGSPGKRTPPYAQDAEGSNAVTEIRVATPAGWETDRPSRSRAERRGAVRFSARPRAVVTMRARVHNARRTWWIVMDIKDWDITLVVLSVFLRCARLRSDGRSHGERIAFRFAVKSRRVGDKNHRAEWSKRNDPKGERKEMRGKLERSREQNRGKNDHRC